MSREIKFRVWDTDSKKYWNIENWHVEDEYIDLIEPNNSNADPNVKRIWKRESDVVIEQYTGVKDTYGEEIYEGDVVHGYDQEPDRDDGYIGSSVIEVVNFKWGSFWLGDFKNRIMLYTPPIIEVIGNVHTNPELLEAQHEN